MIKAESLYIQALPGCGKTEAIQKLRERGVFAVDGDDIDRVYPEEFHGSRGARFSRVMCGKGRPDVVLSSYWAKDFAPELEVFSSLVIGKRTSAWLDETRATRPDLHEAFDSDVLSKWGQSYERLHDCWLNGEVFDWFDTCIILDANEYVSDHIDLIVSLVADAK